MPDLGVGNTNLMFLSMYTQCQKRDIFAAFPVVNLASKQ